MLARPSVLSAMFAAWLLVVSPGCGEDGSGSTPSLDAGMAGDAASQDANPPDGPTPEDSSPGDVVVTPPPDLAGHRIFVPRIVPGNGSDAIWDHRQRAAVFWFGRVDARNDYVDVRLGTRDDLIMVHSAIFDREIYDDASDDTLEAWDSLTLLLDADGDPDKQQVDGRSLRIDAQAGRHGTERTVVYRGVSGTWQRDAVDVGTDTSALVSSSVVVMKGYRGDDDRNQSRGWHITFFVKWTALGLTAPPMKGATPRLRAALVQHDRDNASGSLAGATQSWPHDSVTLVDPGTWGTWELIDAHFLDWTESGSAPGAGRPAYAIAYTAPDTVAGTERTITIREGLDGVTTAAACVGASEVLCSGDDDYNFGTGTASWGGNTSRNYFHVQNQEDYADWPCFAKIYLKFPLDSIPPHSAVLSAKLILHHKQPTSGGDEGERSLLQAFWVSNTLQGSAEPWTEENLTWNSAPWPWENLAGCWGDRTGVMETGWDDLPAWEWDVTRAVAESVADGQVSLAIYSADSEYHTGKEFVTPDDFPDWGDPSQRPTLEVVVADRAP